MQKNYLRKSLVLECSRVLLQDALLAADFEIGVFIREWLVPRAVLYFTGEILDDDEVSYIIHLMICEWCSWR